MAPVLWITLPAITAALLSAMLTPLVVRLAVAVGAVDMPGHRKIHTAPIPRLGGLAVVASIAMVVTGAHLFSRGRWQVPPHLSTGLALGIMPIFLVSLVDDMRSVGARVKFLAHTIGAIIAVSFGIALEPVVHLFGAPIHIGLFALPLSVLWMVGVTNAFNIIDGLDGLAAGLALISASGMAAVFMILGEWPMAGVTLVMAGALAGFLPYNVHPAKLFLGDTGATAIGFGLAAFALKGGSTLSVGFAALLPVFILGLPIADTLISMARRTIRRLEYHTGGVFQADGNHIHHRLLAAGIDHGRAVMILYGAGLVFTAAALVSIFLNVRAAGFFIATLILAGFVGIHRLGYDEFAFLRRGTVLKMYELPTVKRGMFVVFVDVLLAAIAAYVAVGLKTDHWTLSQIYDPVLDLATAFAPVTVLIFWGCGMYRGSWHVAKIQDLTRCFKAVAIVTVAGAIIIRLMTGNEHAVSLFGIYGILSLLLTVSLRSSYVVLENTRQRASHTGRPVLVYGAGGRGVAAVRELFQTPESGLKPIGFIDDDVSKRGRLVSGLPVFGTARELEGIIRKHGAHAVLVASEKISDDRVERAALACRLAAAQMFRFAIKLEYLSEGAAQQPLALPTVGDAERAATPLLLAGVEHCPSCKGQNVQRSQARNMYEHFRRTQTTKRLFRCHQCGWRGWLAPLDSRRAPVVGDVLDVDLSHLDDGFDAASFANESGDR